MVKIIEHDIRTDGNDVGRSEEQKKQFVKYMENRVREEYGKEIVKGYSFEEFQKTGQDNDYIKTVRLELAIIHGSQVNQIWKYLDLIQIAVKDSHKDTTRKLINEIRREIEQM